MKDKRILFYVPGMDVINDGVYYSQVFALARYAVTLGAKSLVVYTSSEETEAGEFSRDGVEVLRCAWDSTYTSLPFLPKKYLRLTRSVESKIHNFSPTHVYVRDPFSGYAGIIVAKKMNAKLVFSRRGAGIVSEKLTLKTIIQEIISRFYLWQIFRKADHVNTVSQVLLNGERRWYKGPMSVLQCCVMPERLNVISSEERDSVRKSLDIPVNAKVVAYSGGLSSYQCIDDILALMKRMFEVDKKLYFLLLTKSQDVLLAKLRQVGLPEVCVRTKSCTPVEVSRYLQVADVAVILRKNNLLNRTASPVKIGEYLASGLGVIMSRWIGDAESLYDGQNFAFLADDETSPQKTVEFVCAMDADKRVQARGFVTRHFTYEGNEDVVRLMFA